jgi:hypothetical protein
MSLVIQDLYSFQLTPKAFAEIREIFRAERALFLLFRGTERRAFRFSREFVYSRQFFFGYDHSAFPNTERH